MLVPVKIRFIVLVPSEIFARDSCRRIHSKRQRGSKESFGEGNVTTQRRKCQKHFSKISAPFIIFDTILRVSWVEAEANREENLSPCLHFSRSGLSVSLFCTLKLSEHGFHTLF